MDNKMNALIPPTSLNCERCHGHGHVTSAAGRLACLNCSAAANDPSPWTPASQPPVCEPGSHAGISIECVGIVVADNYRGPEIVAYWPAVDRWTVMRKDRDGDWFDEQITVTHYYELPEMPQEAA